MGIGPFDSAGLSAYAYAHVLADGTTTSESGVTISRVAPGSGTYLMSLPAGKALPDNECFVHLQAWGATLIAGVSPVGPATQRQYLLTFLTLGGAPQDNEFTVTIYRTTAPVP